MSQVALQDNSALTPQSLEVMTVPEQVESLASQGLTMKQIALCLGIDRSTLYVWKNNKKDISDSLKRGRAKGLAAVTRALLDNARSGNVVAQIFYLKNRSPEEWRDRRELVVDSGTQWVINASPKLTVEEWQAEHGLPGPTVGSKDDEA